MKRPYRVQAGNFVGRPYKAVSGWNPKTGEVWDYKDYKVNKCKAFNGWYYLIEFIDGTEFKSKTFESYHDMQVGLIKNDW